MYNPFSLQNKTILVTGASSGIGKAIAIECSKMGAKVFVTGRNEQRLQETFNQLDGEFSGKSKGFRWISKLCRYFRTFFVFFFERRGS